MLGGCSRGVVIFLVPKRVPLLFVYRLSSQPRGQYISVQRLVVL